MHLDNLASQPHQPIFSCLCIYRSVSVHLLLSASVRLFLYLYQPLCICLSISISLCASVSHLYLPLCVCFSISISLFVPVSLSIYLCSVFAPLSVCIWFPVTILNQATTRRINCMRWMMKRQLLGRRRLQMTMVGPFFCSRGGRERQVSSVTPRRQRSSGGRRPTRASLTVAGLKWTMNR